MPSAVPARDPSTKWPLHYCGVRHPEKYDRPPLNHWLIGGIDTTKLPQCQCKGLEHAERCERRALLQRMQKAAWADKPTSGRPRGTARPIRSPGPR